MGFQKIIIILIFFFCLNEVFSKDNLDRKIPPPEPYNKEHLLKSGGSGMFNNKQYLFFFSLDQESQKQHKEAIYFMLNNVLDGQIVSWLNENNKDYGQTRVLESYEISTGYCRVYQSVINSGNQTKNERLACWRVRLRQLPNLAFRK